MSTPAQHSILQFKRSWQLWLWFPVFLLAFIPAVLLFVLTGLTMASLLLFFVIGVLGLVSYRPFSLAIARVVQYIDAGLGNSQHSAGLLFKPEDELSSLAQLQRYRTSQKLAVELKDLQPPVNLKRFGLGLLAAVAFTMLLVAFLKNTNSLSGNPQVLPEDTMAIRALDSAEAKIIPPKIIHQEVTVRYPAYTGMGTRHSGSMDVKALEGSQVTWTLQFDQQVDSVFMMGQAARYDMVPSGRSYQRSRQMTASGFYNFTFQDTLGNRYSTDLHSLETVYDNEPLVVVLNVDQFTSFEPQEDKTIRFDTQITDDYGIGDAFIVATVSRGSGESVKFREEKIPFDSAIAKGEQQQSLAQRLNLDDLKMEPGDELYFYVHAQDLKTPKPNVARSETYFAVIKDTTQYEFVEAGGMGVDLLPDYFRSQRQLIIDTEKLIRNKPNLSTKEFNSTSNELAFDQKSLRLKYGEFMGDEAQGGLAAQQVDPTVTNEESDDPLAGYSHKHDGSNEHNLVEEEQGDGHEGEDENLLEKYVHNHEDPEESTLFAKSLKSKLRRALNIMWDAELHLRMYDPQKSLPYQYQALELIQEIKNSARIYVHRIGFDPPPIKEDKRLSGDLKDVDSFTKQQDIKDSQAFQAMRKAVSRLEKLISLKAKMTPMDQQLLKEAGTELAALAIEHPGDYLETLQQLNWASQDLHTSRDDLKNLHNALLKALPSPAPNPVNKTVRYNKLDALLVKKLDADE